MRHLAAFLFLATVRIAVAQEGGQSPRPATLVLTPVTKLEPPLKVSVLGEHDTPPATPGCEGQKAQARLDCLARDVMKAVRSRLETSAQQVYANSEPIVIDLSINQFGEVKQINVKHAGTPDLPRQVNVAVYAMPKFIPAMKGEAGVASVVSISMPPSALFQAKE